MKSMEVAEVALTCQKKPKRIDEDGKRLNSSRKSLLVGVFGGNFVKVLLF